MVYEYLDDIKKSGINRDGFPATCSSYMEMGMYAAVDTTRELNKVFETAGILEFNKYQAGTLTEANIKEIKDVVLQKAQKILTAFWEKVKAAFERAIAEVTERLAKFADIGKKFEAIASNMYTEVLKKVFGADEKEAKDMIDVNRIDAVAKKLSTANYKITGDIKNSKTYDKFEKAFTVLIKRAIDADIENSAAYAKTAIEKYVEAEPLKTSYKFILSNKKNIADTIKDSPKKIKADYADAKKAIDTAKRTVKELTKDGNDIKTGTLVEAHLAIAYQTCVLGILDVRRKAFVQAVVLAGKAVVACKVGDDNATKKEKAAKKEAKATAKNESYNAQFVADTFSW